MKILHYTVTVGEEIVFEALDRVKKYYSGKPEIFVWYHPLDGVNLDFYQRLTTYTDNILMCTKNKGTTVPANYTLLNEKFDYLMAITCDALLNENYFERLYKPFKEVTKLAISGGTEFNDIVIDPNVGYALNNLDSLPDLASLVNKEVVNDIGGELVAFGDYGYQGFEWECRSIRKGWSIATSTNIYTHGGTQHEGRSKMKNLEESLEFNKEVFNKAKLKRFMGYNWWDSKI